VEVCNPRTRCTNILTPYALNSNRGTNFDGVCDDGTTCPCLNTVICPSYILSAFTISDGSAIQPIPGQRITFPQTISSNSGPIHIPSPDTEFCLAPLSWLPLSNPGCGFAESPMTLDQLKTCMGGQSNCDGYHSSPCLQGTLSIITNNPDSVTATNYSSQTYGCTTGHPCPCGEVAIYDTNSNTIVCRTI
jgi:hypothetical protein